MNQIEQYRLTAKGIWPHLLPLLEERVGDALRFYRARVVKNPGAGKLSVQRDAGPVVTIPCSTGLADATPGKQILVLGLGTGTSRAEIAVCSADAAEFSSTLVDLSGAGGGITQEDLDDAISAAQDEQEGRWQDDYNALYALIMATSGGVLPLVEGRVIDSVTVLYYLSNSRTVLDGGSWQYGAPTPVAGKYIWTKLYITYTDDGAPTETDPVCVVGPGTWSVWQVVQLFHVSPNGDQLLIGELEPAEWQTTAPKLGDHEYLWTRQRVSYTLDPEHEDGTTLVGVSYTEPYCLSGVIGDLAEQEIKNYQITVNGETYNIDDLLIEMKSGYIAKSDFGTYLQQILSQFSMNEEGMEQDFSFFSTLKANLLALSDSFSSFEEYRISTQGYVRSGIVDYEDGVPVFGVAVGQDLQTEVYGVDADGKEILEVQQKGFRAIYTAKGLSFWQDAIKVASMSDNKLCITDVAALSSLTVEKWAFEAGANGLVIKWGG